MHIRDVVSRDGKDFCAVYECEHCDHTFVDLGSDDEIFLRTIVPSIKCPKCGKKADGEEGSDE